MSTQLPFNQQGPKRKRQAWFFGREKQAFSLIGRGITVVGSLDFGSGEVHLDGRLEGKILGHGTLIIGDKGILNGEIDVGALVLYGRVDGTVVASDSVRIASTGRLCGRIHAMRLVIEEGGYFEGDSDPYSIPATAIESPQEPADK